MPRTTHDQNEFGAVLQRLRRAAGLSQQELAERAGLSLRGIADLERGARHHPYPATVRRLVKALGLDETRRAALLRAAQPDEATDRPSGVNATCSLPVPLSSFVGREHEIATAQQLLEIGRLITLTGTGGIGKTRLALEVARARADAVFVDLAPLGDADLVPAAVAAALGVREQPNAPVRELLSTYLVSRDVLLVLDNCEHLVQACAELAEFLLRTCPRLRVLATSRERLGVAGETSWRVPSLAVPDPTDPIERLQACEAARLFLHRARAVLPNLSLTPDNTRSVASLCQRLDGIPLAIELAAARVNVLSLEQIADRLEDAMRLLVGGSRTAPPRQQTLRATFVWSYELLSEPEQLLFARLSVFVGGWTLEAAEAVCGDEAADQAPPPARLERERVLDLLGQLVDKSLVQVDHGGDGRPRYRLLEPLRQFAAERLAQGGATLVLRERHARWFAALVAEAAGQYHGPRQTAALDRVQGEHANVLAALEWLEREDPDTAARLASRLLWFWIRRDHWQEGRAWLERLLAGPAASAPGPELAELLWAAGSIAWLQGDFPSAIRWVQESVAAARGAGAPAALTRALALAGRVAASRGEYTAAREFFEEGLPLARRVRDRWSEARHLDGLATVALEQADFRTAATLLETCVEVARAMGDAWTLATVLTTLGDVARSQGDYARARQLYEESLALDEGLGSEPRASVLHNLGYVALHAGDPDRSAALFSESLWLYEARGERRGVAECLVGLASVAAALGQRERAARLFGAAEAALETLGVQLSPSNRADYARGLASAKAGASVAGAAAALAAGRGLSLEDAMREAVSVGAARSGRTPPAPAWAPLTMREREVACLIAGGLSNREIAERLVITEATAERHVANILAKLGGRSRAHVAAWATTRGLVETPPPSSPRS